MLRMVAQTVIPAKAEGRGSWSEARPSKSTRPCLKKKLIKTEGGVVQEVESLPSKLEAKFNP
jgi:hypothetical protein